LNEFDDLIKKKKKKKKKNYYGPSHLQRPWDPLSSPLAGSDHPLKINAK
jgi:hypothetical protein